MEACFCFVLLAVNSELEMEACTVAHVLDKSTAQQKVSDFTKSLRFFTFLYNYSTSGQTR